MRQQLRSAHRNLNRNETLSIEQDRDAYAREAISLPTARATYVSNTKTTMTTEKPFARGSLLCHTMPRHDSASSAQLFLPFVVNVVFTIATMPSTYGKIDFCVAYSIYRRSVSESNEEQRILTIAISPIAMKAGPRSTSLRDSRCCIDDWR
jgi:hypothetical protein